jgi:YihY family inner membrane protein
MLLTGALHHRCDDADPRWTSDGISASRIGSASVLRSRFSALIRWPEILFCVIVSVDLVYHFAPNGRGRWVWITPGAVLATALWLVSSFAFRVSVSHVGDYTATYGVIGGAIVTMLWFYVSSIAILVGADIEWRH